MGMAQTIIFDANANVSWPAVRSFLDSKGFSVQVRMIEGELALPDEQPPEQWRELRLGTPAGMVTVRRQPDRITFVVWGNADSALVRARDLLTWAFAHASLGQIETQKGLVAPDQFCQDAGLADC
jgi:hypothetical protein